MFKKTEAEDLRNILLAVGLIMGFIFIVTSSVYLFQHHFGLTCKCQVLLPIFIAILTSLGVFVGIFTYYFLSKSFSKEKEKLFGNVEKTLDFLSPEEKNIVSALIKNNGALAQNKLTNMTKIDSVRLHRRLSNLETRGILNKNKNGMTNKIILNKDLRELFAK